MLQVPRQQDILAQLDFIVCFIVQFCCIWFPQENRSMFLRGSTVIWVSKIDVENIHQIKIKLVKITRQFLFETSKPQCICWNCFKMVASI